MDRTLRVTLLGRALPLRVSDADEGLVAQAAALAEARLQAFRAAFPAQPEMTAPLVVVLEMAQELLAAREETRRYQQLLADALVALDLELAAALARDEQEEQPPPPAI